MPKFKIEDGADYQPYFKAFVLHNNLSLGDETSSYDYIMWNQKKWREWRELNSIDDRQNMTEANHIDFEKWLFKGY
ncbi:hypothetical protein [Paenibacillus silvae]|uniref:Uncharacterized protein n=1 Tax=Paenibacillus silvae TaxID=1325358 RepID=A0A2W6NNX5_9BACL|nr:hypothetical protein [Paenibacillus silvae]PZT57475.1 hypothetical protein DN757_02125 [Paenibacillus silvae]